MNRLLRSILTLSLLASQGCTRRPVPDVDQALLDYKVAVTKGDAVALYSMLSEEERAHTSLKDIESIVQRERAELKEQGALVDKEHTIKTVARVRFEDGEEIGLTLEDRAFRITAGGTLPGGASTPEGALGDLRRALLRRQFGGILRLLAPSTRKVMEADLRSLAVGLEHPETLPLQVKDDRAEVKISGGHVVRLKRANSGVWFVDYFD